MIRESALDNLLVAQKDSIIKLCNNGKLDTAQACLDVVSPLWESVAYGYKLIEIRERIKRERECIAFATAIPTVWDAQAIMAREG